MHVQMQMQLQLQLQTIAQAKVISDATSVTGLDAAASASASVSTRADGATSLSCSPPTQGAFCTVVDLVLTVYSSNNDTALIAEQQVFDQVLVAQLDAGTFVDGDILAVRFHSKHNIPADASAAGPDESKLSQIGSRGEQDSSAIRAVVVSLLLLVVAIAVVVGVLYRRRRADQQRIRETGRSDCDSRSGVGSSMDCDDTNNDLNAGPQRACVNGDIPASV